MAATLSIKDITEALRDQLIAYEDLSYAKDSGYAGNDASALVQLNKFPFFNIIPINYLVTRVPNMSFDELRRNTYEVQIQFATFGIKADEAITGTDFKTGIMDFSKDLLDGIFDDETLDGLVAGFPEEDQEINIDFLTIDDSEGQRYIAGGEMNVKFYKDIAV